MGSLSIPCTSSSLPCDFSRHGVGSMRRFGDGALSCKQAQLLTHIIFIIGGEILCLQKRTGTIMSTCKFQIKKVISIKRCIQIKFELYHSFLMTRSSKQDHIVYILHDILKKYFLQFLIINLGNWEQIF